MRQMQGVKAIYRKKLKVMKTNEAGSFTHQGIISDIMKMRYISKNKQEKN